LKGHATQPMKQLQNCCIQYKSSANHTVFSRMFPHFKSLFDFLFRSEVFSFLFRSSFDGFCSTARDPNFGLWGPVVWKWSNSSIIWKRHWERMWSTYLHYQIDICCSPTLGFHVYHIAPSPVEKMGENIG